MTIKQKKEELRKKIKEAKTEEEIAELRKQVEILEDLEESETNSEERKEQNEEKLDERNLLKGATERLEKRQKDMTGAREIEKPEEERKMSREDVLKSKEYRSAWAKKLMCRPDSEFTADEKRALTEALTTTATEFKAPSGDADGVNNGGLFIPETVSLEILKEIELESPFLKDIAKTFIRGVISFPYKKSGSGVEHPTEGKENKAESDEYGTLIFGQYELSKTIRVTWKLENMAVEDFISYIIEEVSREMREDLATESIYGDGNNTLKGATLEAITVEYDEKTTVLEAIHTGLSKLPKRKKSGAKVYIAEDMALDIAFAKDNNGMYINNPVNGVGINNIAKYRVEVDPVLKDGDFLIGNARNYKMNFNEEISVTKDIIGRARVNDYTGYAIIGGAPVPNSFVYGKKKVN